MTTHRLYMRDRNGLVFDCGLGCEQSLVVTALEHSKEYPRLAFMVVPKSYGRRRRRSQSDS